MNEQELISAKREEYRHYIENHVSNVQKAWEEIQEKCMDVISELTNGYPYTTLEMTTMNISVHDKSKWSEEEFEPYRRYFHSINEKEKRESEAAFEDAWTHHKLNNPHHWNYWIENPTAGGKDNMTLCAVLEMIADWQGMSYAKGGNALSWYKQNKAKIDLGETQKIWVDKLLHALCDK